jgi:SRSO17 transposase
MTQLLPAPTAPGPLETYCQQFDPLFGKRNQRDEFRRYLEGLLLPPERNQTLPTLANTEPVTGAQHRHAQSLQWFLSASQVDAETVNERRIAVLREDPATALTEDGVLVIDEHGDRMWGSKIAHIGKQYLANVGKIDTRVVNVRSLWVDEHLSYPLHVEPYGVAPTRWRVYDLVMGRRDGMNIPPFRTAVGHGYVDGLSRGV